jgi:hypothetical protein
MRYQQLGTVMELELEMHVTFFEFDLICKGNDL